MATRVLNKDRLNRKLKAFPQYVRKQIAEAMEQGAAEVVAQAKNLVPVDHGDLQDSIGWVWGDAPEGAQIIGTIGGGRAGNLRITIYAGSKEAYYARFVEFGTSASHVGERIVRGGRSRVSKGSFGQRAQPYFYPAYRAVKKRIRGRVTRAVNKAAKLAAVVN